MYKLVRPLFFRMDAETAHDAALRAAGWAQRFTPGMLGSLFGYEDERLRQRLWGLSIPNPVGLAAGADKNGERIPFWEGVGFGFVEVGSVSAQPNDGNPKPRAFRLPEDEAVVNRMGLNNDGAEAVAARLSGEKSARDRPLGVNLAKTHDPAIMGTDAMEDFRTSFRHLAGPADYVALNVSCPNTREGKTFEDPAALDKLLTAIMKERSGAAPDRNVPILIKLSPPMSGRVVFDSDLEDLIRVAEMHEVDGYIATNTASDREGLRSSAARLKEVGTGGLSGAPLEARATRLVRYLYTATEGRVPIVGVGGVRDADTAYAKIQAGASLVQLYTALIYEGPGLVKRIKEGLVERLRSDGHASIGDAVGAGV